MHAAFIVIALRLYKCYNHFSGGASLQLRYMLVHHRCYRSGSPGTSLFQDVGGIHEPHNDGMILAVLADKNTLSHNQ